MKLSRGFQRQTKHCTCALFFAQANLCKKNYFFLNCPKMSLPVAVFLQNILFWHFWKKLSVFWLRTSFFELRNLIIWTLHFNFIIITIPKLVSDITSDESFLLIGDCLVSDLTCVLNDQFVTVYWWWSFKDLLHHKWWHVYSYFATCPFSQTVMDYFFCQFSSLMPKVTSALSWSDFV